MLICHAYFFFFVIIDLYILIPAVIVQIFIPIVEHIIPTGTQNNEENSEIERQNKKVFNIIQILTCLFILFHLLKHCPLLRLKVSCFTIFFLNLNSRLASCNIFIFKMDYFVILFIAIHRKQISII